MYEWMNIVYVCIAWMKYVCLNIGIYICSTILLTFYVTSYQGTHFFTFYDIFLLLFLEREENEQIIFCWCLCVFVLSVVWSQKKEQKRKSVSSSSFEAKEKWVIWRHLLSSFSFLEEEKKWELLHLLSFYFSFNGLQWSRMVRKKSKSGRKYDGKFLWPWGWSVDESARKLMTIRPPFIIKMDAVLVSFLSYILHSYSFSS